MEKYLDKGGNMQNGSQNMWFMILIATVLTTLMGIIYMTACLGRFIGLQMLSNNKPMLKYLFSFLILVAIFMLISHLMSTVNAVVIFLHEVMFFAMFEIVMRIIKHCTNKEFTINWQGWLAIIFSIVYLAVGYYLLHHVWKTNYELKTDKNISLKMAVFADSHIGTTFDGEGFAKHMQTIDNNNPDIVLIPGDFVDDWSNKKDLIVACEALGKMKAKYGVWYAYGNHDEGFFNNRDFSAKELEEELTKNGVHILADEFELVDNSFYVVGRLDSSIHQRKDINELLEGVDESKYIIVLDHEPTDYENESKSIADLVVSGHTHGGQLIPLNIISDVFKINDRNYGHERRQNTDFIVTSGISDWAIQFKTGTKSEYVIINVEQL